MSGIERKGRRAFTMLELLISLVLAAGVLAMLWYFVTAIYGNNAASSASARFALEATEFLEYLADDLFHARYIVYEAADGAGGLTIVIRRLDASGKPTGRLVRYRILGGGRTVEREEDSKPPKITTVTAPDESKQPIRMVINRVSGELTVTLADRDITLPINRDALAPAGATSSEAETVLRQQDAADQLDLADEAGGAPEGGAGAGSTETGSNPGGGSPGGSSGGGTRVSDDAAGPGDPAPAVTAQTFSQPQPGQPVSNTAFDNLDELSYQFLGGGDEQPSDGGSGIGPGLDPFTAASNLDFNRRKAPLVFGRRQDVTNPDADWLARLPNPVRGVGAGNPGDLASTGADGSSVPNGSSNPTGSGGPDGSGSSPDGTAGDPTGGTTGGDPAATPNVSIGDVDAVLKRAFADPANGAAEAAKVIKQFVRAGSPGIPQDGALPPDTASQFPFFALAYQQSRPFGAAWGRPGAGQKPQ